MRVLLEVKLPGAEPSFRSLAIGETLTVSVEERHPIFFWKTRRVRHVAVRIVTVGDPE